MKAYLIRERGVERNRIEDVEIPEISQGEVLVKVKMAGVHPMDYSMAEELSTHGQQLNPFPHIPGEEISGTIYKLYPGENTFKIGQRVIIYHRIYDGTCDLCQKSMENLCRNGGRYGVNANGGFAEYMKVPVRNVIAFPRNMGWETATCFPVSFITPYHAFKKAGVSQGETVAIFGATGNTGIFAVQIAKSMGAKVFAISREESEWLTGYGADFVIKYNEAKEKISKLTGGKMCDYVLDPLGASTFDLSLSLTGANGKWISYGEATGSDLKLNVISLYRYEKSLLGSRGGTKKELEYAVNNFQDIKVRIWKKYRFDDISEAINMAGSGHKDGKIFVEFS